MLKGHMDADELWGIDFISFPRTWIGNAGCACVTHNCNGCTRFGPRNQIRHAPRSVVLVV